MMKCSLMAKDLRACVNIVYYIAGSPIRQDGANLFFSLVIRVGNLGLTCPLWICSFVSQEIIFFWPWYKCSVDLLFSVIIAVYWPISGLFDLTPGLENGAHRCKPSLISTIMDKSPWDSQSVTSILCVSQVMSQKAVLSFYKCTSPPNTMLKDQRNCALTVSTLSVWWGKWVGGRDVQCQQRADKISRVLKYVRTVQLSQHFCP